MYNYSYLPDDYYLNVIPVINGNSNLNYRKDMNTKEELYTPEEGYTRGNLFINLYDGYKNYQPQPTKAKSEEEAMYLNFSKYAFAMHELKLYLDLHPEDKSMLLLFNDYREKANKLMEEYEQKYGPITSDSEGLTTKFAWQTSNWPWEGGIN